MTKTKTKEKRCCQCWRRASELPPDAFEGRIVGKIYHNCKACRAKYKSWGSKSLKERMALAKPRPTQGFSKVRLIVISHNRKTGPIPVSSTENGSCPPSCAFNGQGCYAEFGRSRLHWSKVPELGMEWDKFCDAVYNLPRGQIWRHNEAGDLVPSSPDVIDPEALQKLANANVGRRGFTYTHYSVLGKKNARNAQAIAEANDLGFVINLSANNVKQADEYMKLDIGPVVVVLESTTGEEAFRTPDGHQVVICPAETTGIQCAQCQLCQKKDRKSIVAFRAHGQGKKYVDSLVQIRRKSAHAKEAFV